MDVFTAVYVGCFALTGAGITAYGLILRYRPPSPRKAYERAVWWAAKLDDWGLRADAVTRMNVGADLQRTSAVLRSYTLVWGGAAFFAVVTAYAALSYRVSGVVDVPPSLQFYAVWVCPFSFAASIGYLRGIRHLRRSQAGGRSYGDLRPRRGADYRSPLFPLATALFIAVVALATALVGAQAGPTVQLGYGIDTTQPAHWWLFALVPAEMALSALGIELLIRRVTELPRLLISPNVEGAWRADEMLRSRQINALQAGQWISVGYLAWAQLNMLSHNIVHAASYPAQRQPLFVLLMLCAAFLPVVGMVLQSCQGRLGGRVTGWPWRHVAA